MIAYDGSETTDKAIAGIAGANVLRSLPGHVVMVGADNEHNQRSLQKATAILAANGRNVQAHLVQGNVVDSLMAFRERHNTGLMVMGAYGHSRVREFFLGSNTSNMITRSPVPLLLLR